MNTIKEFQIYNLTIWIKRNNPKLSDSAIQMKAQQMYQSKIDGVKSKITLGVQSTKVINKNQYIY
jgi:hypothetical protein